MEPRQVDAEVRGGPQRIPRPAVAVPGPVAPWAGLAEAERRIDLASLARRLANRAPLVAAPEPFPVRRSAAVLVPLYDHGDGPTVVLTRRPTAMRAHTGEVSFPGGGQDPDDADLVATALREAHEEVGLSPQHVEVIGQLDPLTTVSSGAAITPVVGLVTGMPALRAEPSEVDAILHVSLVELLRHDVYREERWPFPDTLEAPLGGWPAAPDGLRPMFFYELIGDTVWGATAAMLTQLLRIATGTEGA